MLFPPIKRPRRRLYILNTASQVVQNLKEALTLLEKEQANPKKLEKINEDVSKYLQLTKQILMGTPGKLNSQTSK